MPRVIGIDPGTVSIDICGLDDGRLFLDRSLPTAQALADPSIVVGLLEAAGPLDFVVGPSGYGLPLKTPVEGLYLVGDTTAPMGWFGSPASVTSARLATADVMARYQPSPVE